MVIIYNPEKIAWHKTKDLFCKIKNKHEHFNATFFRDKHFFSKIKLNTCTNINLFVGSWLYA